ncbi:CoA transferase [Streptomyces fuscigenes]|nr:CoA transferase [Streptomyces fuscigenes]
MAAMTLAELGADVVRVDRPVPSLVTDGLDRGRRSVVVDLKHPGGAEAVLRLAERADVLIEAYRPGVAERLGVGPEAALARNPRLVYGRMTGWGQSGPRATTAGHDINYISLTGALSAIGRAGGPPQVPVNLLGDFGGGSMYLLVGILSALHHATATGEGQVVDAAIVDGLTHLSSMVWAQRRHHGWRDERGTNLLDTGRPFYDVYETSDGGWFAVGALEPQFFARLVELLGLPEWAGDQYEPERWPAMRAAFTEAFKSRTRGEWERVFEGSDACASPVLDWAEAVRDPHLAARGTHDRVDGGDVPSPAPRFSATPTRTAAAPGPVGADGAGVLADWGVRDADGLVASGAVPPGWAGGRGGAPSGTGSGTSCPTGAGGPGS